MAIEIKEQLGKVKQEVRKQTMTYVAGGLSLVAGLAWNDAIKSLIDWFFPLSGNSIVIKFLYAGVLTLVIVIMLTYLNAWFSDEK